MIITRKLEGNKKETKIEDELCCSGKIICTMTDNDGDNSSAKFTLFVEQEGQVDVGCDLQLCGPVERGSLLPFLKQVVRELELVDDNEKSYS